MPARQRVQLVVSLGEGDEGRDLRGLIDGAAKRAGRRTTPWAREQLRLAAVSPQKKLVCALTTAYLPPRVIFAGQSAKLYDERGYAVFVSVSEVE